LLWQVKSTGPIVTPLHADSIEAASKTRIILRMFFPDPESE
jgi:hypothetical protein